MTILAGPGSRQSRYYVGLGSLGLPNRKVRQHSDDVVRKSADSMIPPARVLVPPAAIAARVAAWQPN